MTVNTRTNPSLRLKLRLLVNRQVMKMTTRRNNARKTTKMFVQLGVSQIVVLEQAVLRPLLEVKWVKLTMLYGTTSVLILSDIQVFWHWIMFPDWVPSVSTWIVLYAFLYTGSYRPICIFHMLSLLRMFYGLLASTRSIARCSRRGCLHAKKFADSGGGSRPLDAGSYCAKAREVLTTGGRQPEQRVPTGACKRRTVVVGRELGP